MNDLASKIHLELLAAIDDDNLVLPTLPEVALRIRQVAEQNDVTVAGLAGVIGQDAALSARLIKVVNSPLLRARVEATNLQTAINRLGINYSSNLAIGLVIEQIFHARAPAVADKMRDVWLTSLEVAGISSELCSHYCTLAADQAALAGLTHLIGVLPILSYAQERDELLSDRLSLEHVIEHIHPTVGQHILARWEFPQALVDVPMHCLQAGRGHGPLDYGDIVMIARLIQRGDESALMNLQHLPALSGLHGNPSAATLVEQVSGARALFH